MPKRFVFPSITEYTLVNGLRVILLPHTEQDGLVCAMQFPTGRFCDPQNFEGSAELCVGLLQKGTSRMSSEQLSDTFEHHGASLFAEAGEEHIMIGIKMLSRFKEQLLPCFWEMIAEPRFDHAEFARLQQEMITALKAEANDPGSILNRHFYHELAGGDAHPAGRHHTIRSIKNISVESIREIYSKYIFPKDAVFVLAGNFSQDWFSKAILPLLEGWSHISTELVCDAPAVENRTQAIRFIEKNDLTQVSMILGQAAPGELHPDRNCIALGNYVLGAGNFSSRLMNRVRSIAGRTYSIASHITSERYFGALTINTSTQNHQVGDVLRTIFDEYEKFCTLGITGEELETVKKLAIGNMAFQLEGLTNLVEKILWLSFYHRTIDYIETFDSMINSITLESVNSALKRCFDPEKLIITAIGRKKEVLPQLTGFGAITFYHFKDIL